MKKEEIMELFRQKMADVSDLVNRTNKSSVLVVQQFPIETDVQTLIPAVRESISNVLAFIELGDVSILNEILTLADGFFDHIVFDTDIKCNASTDLVNLAKERTKKSKIFFYSDNNTWANSAIELIQQLHGGLIGKTVFLTGDGLLADLLFQKLTNANALVTRFSAENKGNITPSNLGFVPDIIVGGSIKCNSLPDAFIDALGNGTMIFDVGIGNFSSKFISACLTKNAPIFRVDIRAGISSAVLGILETDYLIRNIMGSANLNGVEIVAGGTMGKQGAIIVDDIKHPNYIIGIADGAGNVREKRDEDTSNVEFVKRLIGIDQQK